MRSLEGGNQLRERGNRPNPRLNPFRSSPPTCLPPNSGSRANPPSSSPFPISLLGALPSLPDPYSPCDQDDDTKRVPSHSDQEKRKGRAESDESAPEKHGGPHGWSAGGGVEAWPREANGRSTPARESARGGDATP